MATSDFLSARRDGVRWRAGDRTCHTSGYNLLVLAQQSLARLLPAAGLASYDGLTVTGSRVRADGAWGPMSSRALYAVARAQGAREGLLAGLHAEATALRVGPSTVATMLWVLRRNNLAQPPLTETTQEIALPADTVYPRWGHTLPRPAGWRGATLPSCTAVTAAAAAWPVVADVAREVPEAPPRPQEAPPEPAPVPAPELPPEPVVAGPPEPPDELAPLPHGLDVAPTPPRASPVGGGTVLLILGGLGVAGLGGWWAIRKSKERSRAQSNPAGLPGTTGDDPELVRKEQEARKAMWEAEAVFQAEQRATEGRPSPAARAAYRAALVRYQEASDAVNAARGRTPFAGWDELWEPKKNPIPPQEVELRSAQSRANELVRSVQAWADRVQRLADHVNLNDPQYRDLAQSLRIAQSAVWRARSAIQRALHTTQAYEAQQAVAALQTYLEDATAAWRLAGQVRGNPGPDFYARLLLHRSPH